MNNGYFNHQGNKFGAKKVTLDGITFDSKKECQRWGELQMLEKAGEISGLERQASYELIPSQFEICENGRKGKCLERAVNYKADFVYYDKAGKLHVEDSKGMKTKDYIIKRKLMLYVHGIRIEEV